MTSQVLPLTSGSPPKFAWRLPQAIAAVKNEKMPAGQWKALLRSLMGKGQFKLTEIEDSKIDAWLDARADAGSIRRQDIVEAISFGLPSIKEVQRRGSTAHYKPYGWHDALPNAGEYVESVFYFPTVDEDFGDRIDDLDFQITDWNMRPDEMYEHMDEILALDKQRAELLAKRAAAKSGRRDVGWTHFSDWLKALTPDAQAEFAHMRWSTCVIDGKKTLFIHEMQSDWAQQGRKEAETRVDYRRRLIARDRGVPIDEVPPEDAGPNATYAVNERRLALATKRNVPVEQVSVEEVTGDPYADWTGAYKPAPLIRETDMWVTFLLRRATQIAAETGCEQMTWINGRDMINGGNPQYRGGVGFDEFYQKFCVNYASKIAKPFDVKLELFDVPLRGEVKKLARMPIVPAMAALGVRQQVYSRAQVIAQARHDPRRAETLRRFLQDRLDGMTGPEMRGTVAIVDEILSAHDEGRAAGSLVGRVCNIAFNARDPVKALDHEAFHFACRYQMDPATRRNVLDRFRPGSSLQLRIASALLRDGDVDAAAQTAQSAEEAAAHAFAYWNRGEFKLSEEEPATRGLRSIFATLRRHIETVTAWISESASTPMDFAARVVRASQQVDRGEVDRTELADEVLEEDVGPSRRGTAVA